MGAAPGGLTVSLAGFQRAMRDIAASPALGAAVLRDPAGSLAAYPLSEREVRRLADAAGQRGMRVNRMLYRSNRMSPVASQLRHTCIALGGRLREVADGFWAESPMLERNAPREVRGFAAYLRRWLPASGADPVVGEVLAWEMACYELGLLPPGRLLAEVAAAAARAAADAPLRPHPLVAVARFGTDPAAVIDALVARRPPPYPGAAHGDYALLVDYRVEPRTMGLIPIPLADAFARLREGGAPEAGEAEELLALGIAVRG